MADETTMILSGSPGAGSDLIHNFFQYSCGKEIRKRAVSYLSKSQCVFCRKVSRKYCQVKFFSLCFFQSGQAKLCTASSSLVKSEQSKIAPVNAYLIFSWGNITAFLTSQVSKAGPAQPAQLSFDLFHIITIILPQAHHSRRTTAFLFNFSICAAISF